MRVSSSHVLDEGDLFLGMLVRVAVRAVGTICQRADSSVVFLSPTVDVLPAGFVADGGICYAVFERILNYHLLKPHILCYRIHSE